MVNKLRSLASPIYVFIDTEVFIRKNFDFQNDSELNILINHSKSGTIKLITSDIVINELKSNIKEIIEENIGSIDKRLKSKKLTNLTTRPFSGEILYDSIVYVNEMNDIIDNFFKTDNFYKLDTSDINIDNILHRYFSNKTPFINRNKKSEFPDAFNLSMIKNNSYINKHLNSAKSKFVIISNDTDYKGDDSYILYDKCESFLVDLSDRTVSNSKLIEYINKNSNYFINYIHGKFNESRNFIQSKMSINGITHNIYGGHVNITNLKEISINSIYIDEIYDINVLGTDTNKNSEIVNLKSYAIFDISYIYEINNYNNIEVYSAKDRYKVPFNANLGIPIDYEVFNLNNSDKDRELTQFLNRNINININFSLSIQTLISHNINMLSSYELDTNYICPSCGVQLTPYNDRGGVCENCYNEYDDHFDFNQ